MLRTARLVLVGGGVSYRALFNWTSPAMFAGTLLAGPTFQLIFFVYLGRDLRLAGDTWYVVGNAVLGCSVAGVFGGTMAIANERRYGTLAAVLLSPRARAAVFLGRGLPYVLNGLVISVFVLAVAALLGWGIPLATVPGVLLAMVVGAAACVAFGLTLGAVGLRLRDVWLVSNISAALLLLLTGVNVARPALPAWMRAAGDALPLTHAAEAARAFAAGRAWTAALPAVAEEAAVGTAYALLAVVLMRVFEVESRRRAALDAV